MCEKFPVELLFLMTTSQSFCCPNYFFLPNVLFVLTETENIVVQLQSRRWIFWSSPTCSAVSLWQKNFGHKPSIPVFVATMSKCLGTIQQTRQSKSSFGRETERERKWERQKRERERCKPLSPKGKQQILRGHHFLEDAKWKNNCILVEHYENLATTRFKLAWQGYFSGFCCFVAFTSFLSNLWGRLQWRIQDFGQGGPAEFLTPGGLEHNICSKQGFFSWNFLKTVWFWKTLGGKGTSP